MFAKISMYATGIISALVVERIRGATKQQDPVQLEAALEAARRAGITDTAEVHHGQLTLNVIRARQGERGNLSPELNFS